MRVSSLGVSDHRQLVNRTTLGAVPKGAGSGLAGVQLLSPEATAEAQPPRRE